MAQTQRSAADLFTLEANNTTGDISPTDLRDAIESLRNGHGEIAVTSSSETSIGTKDVFVQCAGTYTLSGNTHNWDMNTQGQLRYIGAADRVVHIAASWSATSAGNAKIYRVAVAKTGTPIAVSEVQRKIAAGADVGSSAAHAFIDVSTNDYISLMVANASDTTDVTMLTLNLFCMDMLA
jgi:hypothetical protein